MFEALREIFCFVTAAVSFIYGTRVAWFCGKKCPFREKPAARKELLMESVPAAIFIYFFGFVIVFNFAFDGFVTISVFSLISAIVLTNLVVSMAMPELKRKPRDLQS